MTKFPWNFSSQTELHGSDSRNLAPLSCAFCQIVSTKLLCSATRTSLSLISSMFQQDADGFAMRIEPDLDASLNSRQHKPEVGRPYDKYCLKGFFLVGKYVPDRSVSKHKRSGLVKVVEEIHRSSRKEQHLHSEPRKQNAVVQTNLANFLIWSRELHYTLWRRCQFGSTIHRCWSQVSDMKWRLSGFRN